MSDARGLRIRDCTRERDRAPCSRFGTPCTWSLLISALEICAVSLSVSLLSASLDRREYVLRREYESLRKNS